MTKVIRKEEKNEVEFGSLKVGDCFFDEGDAFCIKVNSTTCLVAYDDDSWKQYSTYDPLEKVFLVNVEIHIVN